MHKFNLFSSKIGALVLIAAILAVVFFSYYPVLTNNFVFWDDDAHLFENVTLSLLDMEHIKDIFTSTVNKLYIPLTIFSFAIEHHFFGFEPFVYYLDNLLLHMAIVAFIFWLGLRLGLSVMASGIAALIFGIHPMHVESVAWVTERKDVLYAFFYMAALLSYSRYLDFTHSTQSLQIKKSYRFLVLTFMFGVLSMLAKPMALSLPLILLLLDWFHERKLGAEIIIEKIPLGVMIAGITLISYVRHARIPGRNIMEGFLIWIWTFIFYLRQFIYPVFSVPIYQLPKPIIFSNPDYFLPVIAFGIILFLFFRLRKYPWFVFSVAFYFFSIFFLLRFDDAKDANVVADRFMYLPSLGFCFLIGVGWDYWAKSRLKRTIGIILLLCITTLFSIKTYQQCQIWNNSISLWEHQLKYFPDERIALNNYAAALMEQEEYKEAEKIYLKSLEMQAEGTSFEFSDQVKESIQKVESIVNLYKRAIKADPEYSISYYNYGNMMRIVGRLPEAVVAYKEALKLNIKYKDAHFRLGDLYRKAGDYKQAIFAYNQTITTDPENEDVYYQVISAYNETLETNPNLTVILRERDKVIEDLVKLVNNAASPKATSFFNLGFLFGEMGDFLRAISAYQMALDLNPTHTKTLYNLGNLYRDQGRLNDALELYQKVVQHDPKQSDAYLNMGTIYRRLGDGKKAAEYFQKAIKADPKNSRAYFGLGFIEEKVGDLSAAKDFYKKSAELAPENKEAFYNLGNVYAKLGQNSEAISAYLDAIKADSEYLDAWINLSLLSFKEKDYKNALKYCDEAILRGYIPPQDYLKALEQYR